MAKTENICYRLHIAIELFLMTSLSGVPQGSVLQPTIPVFISDNFERLNWELSNCDKIVTIETTSGLVPLKMNDIELLRATLDILLKLLSGKLSIVLSVLCLDGAQWISPSKASSSLYCVWMVHSGYHPLKHRPLRIVFGWCTVDITLQSIVLSVLCLDGAKWISPSKASSSLYCVWMVHSGYHPLKHCPFRIVFGWCTVDITL